MHLEHVTVFRCLLQEIAVLPQIDRGGSNYLFTNRVDGRVRHLGKKLFEVVEQRMMRFRQHGNWCVHTHSRNRLPAVFRHGQDARL